MHGAVERWAGWHRPTDQGAVVEIHGHLRARGSDEAEAMLGVMRRAADVRHAHLVRQLAFGLGVDGAPYVVTERLLGPTLEEHVQARGPLPVEEIYEILAQLTSALAAVHARGLVHGGLSPCRVLLCRAEDGGHFVRLLACDLAALRGAVAGVSEAVGTAGFVDEDLRGLGRLVRLMCAGASTDLVPPRAPGPALDRWFFAAEAPRENGFTSARALADAFLEAIGGLTVARILAEFPRPAREE
jgi:serine/threonine protein kinase